MGLLNKLGIGIGSQSSRDVSHSSHAAGRNNGREMSLAAVGAPRAPEQQQSLKYSNGLKEFLWNLDGLGRGTLLDLGPAWQTSLTFFIERGFRVSSDDLLRTWKQFLDEEEVRLRNAVSSDVAEDLTPTGRAARFMQQNLQYPASSFDAVLLWDILDYLEPMVAKQTAACVMELLRPGGVVFAMFHSKKPDHFQRYRIADSTTLQLITSTALCPAQRVYQNREIQDLFGHFRTMKSFVGRDQLRETLFIK